MRCPNSERRMHRTLLNISPCVDPGDALALTDARRAPNIRAPKTFASHHQRTCMDRPLAGAARHDWTLAEVAALFATPFADLVYNAQRVHRAHHEPNTVQMSTLLSIKTGACPEDCAYCPQSVRYHTGVGVEALMPVAQVVERARAARAAGATRFCMGAAYRSPKRRDLEQISQMVREVRALGLETCATLGMLDAS